MKIAKQKWAPDYYEDYKNSCSLITIIIFYQLDVKQKNKNRKDRTIQKLWWSQKPSTFLIKICIFLYWFNYILKQSDFDHCNYYILLNQWQTI